MKRVPTSQPQALRNSLPLELAEEMLQELLNRRAFVLS